MAKDIYAIVGERVREERKRAGLTIEQLADLAGISPSFLAYIETRGRKASLETIQKLAQALRLPLPEFFGDPVRCHDETDVAAKQFAQLIRDRNAEEKDAILDVVRSVAKTIGHQRRR